MVYLMLIIRKNKSGYFTNTLFAATLEKLVNQYMEGERETVLRCFQTEGNTLDEALQKALKEAEEYCQKEGVVVPDLAEFVPSSA